jgi:hypothetical protein
MLMMKGEVVGRPSAVSDNLVQSADQKNLWKMALHNFRTFLWSSTNFTHSSLWDYHSWTRLGYQKDCDETWVSFVIDETKELSKQWMHTYSPNKPNTLKQTLSACQKTDSYCFLGQERRADGGIHATRDHNNIRSVLWNTKKTAQNYWVFGLCPSSSVVETRKHNISETGSVSVLRCGQGRHLLCWVP